jgi:arylsulfatase A-like enzyme
MRFLLIAALLRGDAPQERRPNVVLILTDDQGYGDLGCHGNDAVRTPHVDAFARQSVRVERFYVSPVCSPTRASLLTGRYNYRTGVVDTYIGRSLMHADEVTLAERLGAAGWRTGLFGKWHLGDNYPLRAMDQGFQETLTLRGGGIGQPSDPPGGDHYLDPTLYRNGRPVKTKGYVTDLITEAAIGFIEAHRAEPFFVALTPNAPHTPLETPPGYPLDAGLDDATARVYAMVRNIDDNVGRLLRTLDALKLADDTIVIFMTDNGPQQARYNAGLRGLKTTVFEGGIRVPFYVRWPNGRLKAGHVVKEPAAHIDVLPTLLEACGQKAAEGVDGLSLLPRLRGEAAAPLRRTLFFQWHRGDAPEAGRACAAVEARWKWVQPGPAKGTPLLFDLEADPAEAKDVAALHPEEAERLRRAYDVWFRDVSATRGYAPPRIRIGTAHESPTVLTRQDWRGPKAGWAKDSLGQWEVEVEADADYEVVARFRQGSAGAAWMLTWKGEPVGRDAAAGTELKAVVTLKAGAGGLGGRIDDGRGGTYGVDYLELRKLP